MKTTLRKHLTRLDFQRKRGQIFALFFILLPVILLFTAMGVDFGMIYLTSARLTRAVDSTALRVVTRFDSDMARIQQLAVTTMQANMPEFLNESPTPPWTQIGSSDKYKVTGADGDFMIMDVKADADTNIITISTTAGVDHNTFFLPIAGIRNVALEEFATAERFPACNILVLDISGSMRGSKAQNLVKGVKAFTAEFIDDRDYLSVVTFSTFAKTVFPDIPDENGFQLPTQKFQSGLGGNPSRSADYIVENRVRFSGGTNAAEGMRYAFVEADNFLAQFNAEEREKIKVHYVFFTDGDFNTFRGFARGIGYGIDPGTDPENPLNPSTGATEHTGQLNPVDDLPAFHNTKPLASSQFFNNGDFLEADDSPIIFNGFSGSTGTNYDLNALVGQLNVIASDHSNTVANPNNSSLPGVNAVIQGFRLQDSQWRKIVENNTVKWENYYSRSNFPDDWANMFYERADDGSGYARPRTTATKQLVPYDDGDTPGAGSEPFPDWDYLRGIEFMKQSVDHNIYFPEAYPYSWDPANPNRKQEEFNEYYPGGRMFANVRSTIPDDTTITNSDSWESIKRLHEDAIYFERKGNGLGPSDNLTGNYGSWNYGTERLSDHYPYYTFGGGWNYPDINSGTSGDTMQKQLENNADWRAIGPPTDFYSFEQGKWVPAREDNEDAITREGDWLAEAQAFLARKQHDAKIFTVRLKGGSAGVGKRMANENNGSRYYNDQPMGLYYETNNADELTDIFRKIAQRITARLAE